MSVVALVTWLLFAGAPASTAEGYGHVAFANSGAAAAQADFVEGLALLHDFEYRAAAAAFRRAQAADAGFAMAYWGEAMTSGVHDGQLVITLTLLIIAAPGLWLLGLIDCLHSAEDR